PTPEIADLRNVKGGDQSPDGKGILKMTKGIEVGHIFELGIKYSQSMSATVTDESGKPIHLHMGCYGIGVSRIVAAAIEQHNDNKGIIWPEPMAPFQVAIIPVKYDHEQTKKVSDELYEALKAKGIEVLLDDRKERPGVKFADMDLIGIPYRIVVGEKGIANGTVEFKRRDADKAEDVEISKVIETITKISSF